ncbi:hypothetical protein FRC03_006481 [Tulasnella sp. 419]|nr:hypothetical protein FRC03_006481 [Tulasnella sp. 419]
MLQVEDIQPFRGDETPEDSEKWLTNLVASTATFSESLIFRFLLPRLLGAPPVSEWFEGLGDSPKSSWSAFQEEFRTKWITDSRIRKEEDAWNEFTKHVLTEDMLFGAHLPDPEMIRNSISTWLQDHLRLGSATKRPDSELIQATYSLLPVFLSAHIQMFYDGGPLCFDSFDALKEVSDEVLNLQRVCHQINLRKRSKLMETTIKELSEKVDKLMDALDAGRAQSHLVSSHQSMPLSEVDQTPSENVNWEPCSPLTSVLSVLAPSSNTSEHSTPIPQLLPLSEASDRSMTVQVGLSGSDIAESRDDGTDEGIELQLFRIPDIWRKPAASISKDEKITIIQRAINFALAFKPSLAPNQASSLESAFAIYDRLSCHERDKQRSIGRSSSVDGTYQDILSAITGIHGYCAYDEPFLITNSMNIWARIAEG